MVQNKQKKLVIRQLIFILLISVCFVTIFNDVLSQGSIRRWFSVPSVPRPTGFSGHSLALIDDEIYFIGGMYGPSDGTISTVYSDTYYTYLHPNQGINSWARAKGSSSLQVAFAGTAVSADGTIYVTGGLQDPFTYVSHTRCSTPINGTITQWKLVPAAKPFTARYEHAAVIVGNKLYVLGGVNSVPLNDVTYATIDPVKCLTTGTWTSTTPLEPSTGRNGHAALVYEGRIYVIGGLTLSGSDYVPLKSVYVATPTVTGAIKEWVSTEPMPHALANPAVFIIPSTRKIYVLGGWAGAVVTNTAYSAHIKPNGMLTGWIEEPSLRLPYPLYRQTAAIDKLDRIYLAGGQKARRGEFTNNVYYIPPSLSLTKSSNPAGPVHEGDIITYNISYANTGLTTQVMTLTDVLPFNVNLVTNSVPPTVPHGSTLIWNLGSVPPGGSGRVSFQVQVPLLPSQLRPLVRFPSHPPSPTPPTPTPSSTPPTPTSSLTPSSTPPTPTPTSTPSTTPSPTPPPSLAYILPATIACDTTRFWAAGVTIQPQPPSTYTLQVQLPPGGNPSEMWLLMKGINHPPPTVGGRKAQQVVTSTKSFSASLWSAPITPAGAPGQQITVITHNPRELNALFLLNKSDPPFNKQTLEGFFQTVNDKRPKTFTYILDLPSVATQTIDVIMPFMDITYFKDTVPLQVDTNLTTVTLELAGTTPRTVVVNDPNLGNGLLMTQFLFEIGPLKDRITTTKTLSVTVNTEDSLYTLAPRVCRPVYIENTAWLCSDKAGCISDTAQNIPENFRPSGLYLPLIVKSYP